MDDVKWDKRFLDMAKHIATWSKDPSTKVGAIIVDDQRRVIATGYNGFPRNVRDDVARYEHRETKYKMIVHAEANAIISTVVSPRHNTLYTTKFPCSECTKLIIQAGIQRVVTFAPVDDGSTWAKDAVWAKQMLLESVVHVHLFVEITP